MKRLKINLIFKLMITFLLYLSTISLSAADGYITVDEKTGLPIIFEGGKSIVRSSYVYFGVEPSGKWTWAGQTNNFKIVSDFHYETTGSNEVFDYTFESSVTKIDDRMISYSIAFDNKKDIAKVIGGGIEFKLDASYNEKYGKPRLLDNKTGWVWGDENGDHLKMEFSRPVANVFFERNNPNVIRVYFFRDKIEKLQHSYQATISVPRDFTTRQTKDELFGIKDFDKWFEIDAPFYTAVDLSYLNHMPTGIHGFLKTEGESLVFADGTKAKFWGTSISAGALFATPYLDIETHARRISALGFNLVRFTHHDATWVNPNVFGENATQSTEISEDHMRIIDKWIAELNKVGVYIWFDFHHERYVTENDNIYGFEEIDAKKPNNKGAADIKGYSHFNITIQNAMQSLNRQLITRINKETGEKYADNKGIVFLLLTNENDITHHFGNRLLEAQNVPKHTQIYTDLAKVFADKNNLPYNDVWRSWIPGPSKLFLNDAEHNFNEKLLSSLREDDPNHLVATGNTWGLNPLFSLPALTDGDVIDVHSYGKVGALEIDPAKASNYIHWIAAAQVANMPLSVSEWNVDNFPVPDRHTASLYVAAIASHQGWDAMMQFNYATVPPSRTGGAYSYEMYHDPGMLGTMQAAAIMYRQGYLQEAKKTYAFAPSAEELMNTEINPNTAKVLRTVPEKSKLVIKLPEIESLPWLKPTPIPEDAEIITSSDFSPLHDEDHAATSDTGELYRNWQEGIYTINSAKSKAVMGWIGGRQIDLGEAKFDIKTNSASVSVQSLDDQDIYTSSDIMISFAARAEPKTGRRAPTLAEPVTGTIQIRAQPGLKLFKHRRGNLYTELDTVFENGVYSIELTDNLKTYWLFLRR